MGLGISGVEGDPMHIVITPFQIAVGRTHLEGGVLHPPGLHVSIWPDLLYRVLEPDQGKPLEDRLTNSCVW